MTALIIVPFASFVGCLLIGILVYYHSGKRIEHRLFLAFCLVNALMALSDFLFMQSSLPRLTVLWARMGIAPGLAVSFALHFVLVFGRSKIAGNKPLLAVVYVPNFLYYLYSVLSGNIVAGAAAGRWGNEVVYGRNMALAGASGAWVSLLGFLCILIPLVLALKSGDRRRKVQALLMALGFFFSVVLGSLWVLAKPLAGIDLPRIPSLFTLLQEAVLGYAVWKYGLLDLSPARAARNIVETISDSLVIVDREWRIASHNGALAALSGFGAGELGGMSALDLFSGAALADLSRDAGKAAAPGKGSGAEEARELRVVEAILRAKSGSGVPVEVSVSTLREPDGAMAGYVLVARDVTERRREAAEKERLIAELREAMDNVKTLTGLIPICARCKKVRDDRGLWNQIESYVSQHSEALFSHGICPDCAQELYGKEDWFKRSGS